MGMANVIKYLGYAYSAWSSIPEKHRETIVDAVFNKGFEKAEEWTSPQQTEFDFGDETPVTYTFSFTVNPDKE